MSSPDTFITVVVATIVSAIVRDLFIKPRRETQVRLARLERNLDRLMQHFGLESPDPLSPAVREWLRKEMKINAIKAYREETGVGLKEAKDAVEQAELLSP